MAVIAAQGPPHLGFHQASSSGSFPREAGSAQGMLPCLKPCTLYLTAIEFSPSPASSATFGTFQSHGLQLSICKSKVQFAGVINPVGRGLLLDAGTVPGPGHLCSAWTLPHMLLNKHRCANRGMCVRVHALLRKSSSILGEGEMLTPNAAL